MHANAIDFVSVFGILYTDADIVHSTNSCTPCASPQYDRALHGAPVWNMHVIFICMLTYVECVLKMLFASFYFRNENRTLFSDRKRMENS